MAELSLLRKLKKLKEDKFFQLTQWEKEFISEMYDAVFIANTGMCAIDIDAPDEDIEEFSSNKFGQKNKIHEIYERLE